LAPGAGLRARERGEADECPHEARVRLVEAADSTPAATESLITAWCNQYGLLGILPHQVEVVSLGARWGNPGAPVPKGAVWPVWRHYVRLGGVLGVPARLRGRLRTPGPAACRLPARRGWADGPACPAGTVWQGLGASGGCTSCSAVTWAGRRPRYRTTPAGTALVNLEQLLPDCPRVRTRHLPISLPRLGRVLAAVCGTRPGIPRRGPPPA